MRKSSPAVRRMAILKRVDVKANVHSEMARIGQALGSERRLAIIDLLAQAPRGVDALASLTNFSVASTSQHLQVLRAARVVENARSGTNVIYRLADDSVLRLWIALTDAARARLPEVAQIDYELAAHSERDELIARARLRALLKRGDTVVLDVRPAPEFQHAHVPGAISIPLDELPERLAELPRTKRIVTYCRGTYCLTADEAVAFLRERGYKAFRLAGGWPEWRSEGRPAATGA